MACSLFSLITWQRELIKDTRVRFQDSRNFVRLLELVHCRALHMSLQTTSNTCMRPAVAITLLTTPGPPSASFTMVTTARQLGVTRLSVKQSELSLDFALLFQNTREPMTLQLYFVT